MAAQPLADLLSTAVYALTGRVLTLDDANAVPPDSPEPDRLSRPPRPRNDRLPDHASVGREHPRLG